LIAQTLKWIIRQLSPIVLMRILPSILTFQLGYRAVKVDLQDLDGIFQTLNLKGLFAGLEVPLLIFQAFK